jgi:hypothetical protein
MPTIRETVEIRQPAETVAEYISDPSNSPLYDVNVLELHQESEGPRAKGTLDRGVAKVAGRKLPFVTEITEIEPLHTTYRTVEAPMSWTLDFRIEPIDGESCRVIQEIHASDMSGVFGKLGDAVVAKMAGHDLRASLANLKAILEEG